MKRRPNLLHDSTPNPQDASTASVHRAARVVDRLPTIRVRARARVRVRVGVGFIAGYIVS